VDDFGDEWWHEVIYRGILAMSEAFTRRLLGGERAFPLEDSGGITGYEDCVRAAVKGEKTEESESLSKWLDGWSPEAFEVGAAKARFDE
jgi:hypothetical protein